MPRLRGASLVLAFILAAAPALARTVELTFGDAENDDGEPIANSDDIPQTYGDIRGVIDVRYGAVTELGGAVRRLDDRLRYWDTGYSDLVGVAHCCGLGLTGAAEIALIPLNGEPVTLHAMDFGDYLDRNNPSTLMVFAANDLSVPLYTSPIDPGATAHRFANLEITHEAGLRIQWATAYNIGIDNVSFSIVPLPGAGGLLAAGLAALAVGRRLRAARA